MNRKSLLLVILVAVASSTCVVVGTMAFFLSNVGFQQALVPELVKKRVRLGMSLEEANKRFECLKSEHDNVLIIAKSGLGSWVGPQRDISLIFDSDGLVRVAFKHVFQLDEVIEDWVPPPQISQGVNCYCSL